LEGRVRRLDVDSTHAIDAAEALRAVRATAAQVKQRKQLLWELERRIEQARVEPPCPPTVTSSARRLRVVPSLSTSEDEGSGFAGRWVSGVDSLRG